MLRDQFKLLRQQDEARVILSSPHLIDLNKLKQILTESIYEKDLNQKYQTNPEEVSAKLMGLVNNCVNDKKNDKIANITNSLSLSDCLGQLVDYKFMLIKHCFTNISELINTEDDYLMNYLRNDK